MIQAHKALDAAAEICNENGTIIFLAECADGLGKKDFLDWFDAENSSDLAEKLCGGYQVNGQTAWSLLRIAEKFKVSIITSLPDTETRPLRMHWARNLAEALSRIEPEMDGYILPFGAKFKIKNQ